MKNKLKLIIKYKLICYDIAKAFTKEYFYEEDYGNFDKYFINYTHNIGDDYDGIWDINEWFFSLSDMAIALEHRAPYEVLIEWYDKSLEENKKDNPLPNLKNYIKYPELRN